MSDPQNTTPPAAPPAAEHPTYQPPSAPSAAPAYGSAPAYDAAPAYDSNNGQGAPGAPVPGKTLGIVAFVVSFFASFIGIILGIVALIQSKKAGVKNRWALAAIIVGSVMLVLGTILAAVILGAAFNSVGAACADLGPGVWQLTNGETITCD